MLAAIPAIISLISGIAPTISKALSIPSLQDKAISSLGNALGLQQATVDSINSVVGAMTPNQIDDVKQADYGFYLKNNDQILQVQKQSNEEMADNRAMQNPEVNGMRKEYMRATFLLLSLTIIGSFWLYYKDTISVEEGTLIGILVGGLIAKWGTIGDFLNGTGIDKVLGYFKGDK